MSKQPFHVGQKVVAMETSPGRQVIKDQVYTCAGCNKGYIGLQEFPSETDCFEGVHTGIFYRGGPVKYFAPYNPPAIRYVAVDAEIREAAKETVLQSTQIN